MFWNKTDKLPITAEDKEWVEEVLLFLKDNFGEEYFLSLETILPNKRYYDHTFTGAEADAEFVLNQTKIYMDVEDDIRLEFFSHSPVEMADGTLLTTPSNNINGTWDSTTGTYENDGNTPIITIERSQLKDTQSLIATVVYELSYHLNLDDGFPAETEETAGCIIELVGIAYGFGIFLGNSRFTFNKYSTPTGTNWQTYGKGFLPEQVVAYAMAWLCTFRKEEPVWKDMLNPSMLKYFNQSMDYIQKYPEKIRFE